MGNLERDGFYRLGDHISNSMGAQELPEHRRPGLNLRWILCSLDHSDGTVCFNYQKNQLDVICHVESPYDKLSAATFEILKVTWSLLQFAPDPVGDTAPSGVAMEKF